MSAPQHMVSLAQANRVRKARSVLKHRIFDGEITVAEVLADVPWEARTMTILDLLMAQRRWGRTRSRRLITNVPMLETKKLEDMTPRQRRCIMEGLAL